jgi:hypothetical protein
LPLFLTFHLYFKNFKTKQNFLLKFCCGFESALDPDSVALWIRIRIEIKYWIRINPDPQPCPKHVKTENIASPGNLSGVGIFKMSWKLCIFVNYALIPMVYTNQFWNHSLFIVNGRDIILSAHLVETYCQYQCCQVAKFWAKITVNQN